jgi:N-acetylmuramoyl-L-alanine amidase
MGFFRHGGLGRGCGWVGAVAVVGLCCGGVGSASVRKPVRVSPWDAAVAARERFEAEPAGTHTKAEFTEVLDRFRAIYHDDPADAHAARAVEQVAELLVEQGTELGDKKSLKDGAAQYAFLAKAYPEYARAERRRLAEAKLGGDEVVVRRAAAPARVVASAPAGLPTASAKTADSGRDDRVVGESAESDAAAKRRFPAGMTNKKAADAEATAVVEPTVAAASASGMATVTGIRHWSTATYTRVAIDLAVGGDEDVKYEAARVEHPDRLFFDLHHARLAAGLVGKSFLVSDDGLLTRIRAAQSGDDVTRVVLDVHAVGEYSAFLLPNPERLIIDIHGKQGGGSREEGVAEKPGVGNGEQGVAVEKQAVVAADARSGTSNPDPVLEEAVAPSVPAPVVAPVKSEHVVSAASIAPVVAAAPVAAPIVREPARGAVEVSSLPPMPVTDGSAAFGLPAKSSATTTAVVAQPRVVISSKPTVAKPVPNAVAKTSSATGTEVAAVSEQPGKVEATTKPTSLPVSARSKEQGVRSSEDVTAAGVGGDHYVPRSKRKPVIAPADAGAATAAPPVAEVVVPVGGVADVPAPKKKRGAKVVAVDASPVEAAPPTADGETLVRALGLKIGRIVIDAGHGGHDSGTLGVGGIQEKDVVLDVALRLGKLLHDRLGAEIVYTRADDTFIPLETRTAIANKAQADLFISVHANSSQEPSARGVEVYYLNFTSDPEAMTVASRENAVSTKSVHELSDLVKKIALKDKIEESKELAGDVDASLYAGLTKGNEGLKDRGVKKAPFVVLIGANMPSILAEISFVTNPEDAEQLQTAEYRERVAESLYGGVAKYAAGINAGKVKGRPVERAAR